MIHHIYSDMTSSDNKWLPECPLRAFLKTCQMLGLYKYKTYFTTLLQIAIMNVMKKLDFSRSSHRWLCCSGFRSLFLHRQLCCSGFPSLLLHRWLCRFALARPSLCSRARSGASDSLILSCFSPIWRGEIEFRVRIRCQSCLAFTPRCPIAHDWWATRGTCPIHCYSFSFSGWL